MPTTSYNHSVSTVVSQHLITDTPISRMGIAGAVQVLALAPSRDQPGAVFPEHTRLMAALPFGPQPRQVLTYGLVQGNQLGVVLPSDDGMHAFYITAEYAKMADPAYQDAVCRSLLRVAGAGRLTFPVAAMEMMRRLFSLAPFGPGQLM